MIGNMLRGLKRALVFEIRSDSGRAEGVIVDPGLDAGVGRELLNQGQAQQPCYQGPFGAWWR